MPPNEEADYDESLSPDWSPPHTPFFAPTPPTESSASDSEHEFVPSLPVMEISPTITLYGRINIPVEQNLKDLLVKVTETENLEEVKEVKLKVIARDVSLQHLSIYTPNLSELILDGSIVSSLRDLGCGLVNLKILRINRCGLTSFDGLLGLQSVEGLYAADNEIENLFQLTCLPDVKVLDIRRNKLRSLAAVSFLALCEKLKHLLLEGNNNVTLAANYRDEVKRVLPALSKLDDDDFWDDDEEDEEATEIIEEKDRNQKEIVAISLEDSVSTSSRSRVLPPINNPQRRPATATGISSVSPRNTSRNIHSARESPGDRVVLPSINDGRRLSSPSSLTSGAPICGNIVAALRNRLRPQNEAWNEE